MSTSPVVVGPEHLAGDAALSLQAELRAAAREAKVVVLDLARTSYVDSSALGVIIHAYRELEAKGVMLRLINVPPRVVAFLKTTRLDSVLGTGDFAKPDRP